MRICLTSLFTILFFTTVNAKGLPSRERRDASQTGIDIPEVIDLGRLYEAPKPEGQKTASSHNSIAVQSDLKNENDLIDSIYEGERKEFSIPIKNVSNNKKTIDRVFYTCTCFEKVDETPVDVKPKSETKFKVVFNSYKLKGRVGKTIWVKSGDALFKVTVKADVIKKDGPLPYFHKTSFEVDKAIIEKSHNGYTLMTRLTNTGGKPLKIESVSCPDVIKVILKERELKPDEGASARIVLNSRIKAGTYEIAFLFADRIRAVLVVRVT